MHSAHYISIIMHLAHSTLFQLTWQWWKCCLNEPGTHKFYFCSHCQSWIFNMFYLFVCFDMNAMYCILKGFSLYNMGNKFVFIVIVIVVFWLYLYFLNILYFFNTPVLTSSIDVVFVLSIGWLNVQQHMHAACEGCQHIHIYWLQCIFFVFLYQHLTFVNIC